MNNVLMPKATALWLIENTTLTFKQISDFCNIHLMEIKALADGDIITSLQPLDPIQNGQCSLEDIKSCEQDETKALALNFVDLSKYNKASRGPKYTPLSKRADKPDAITWCLKYHSELSDAQIGKLIGTTKNTIDAVRDRTHWNISNIKARSPIDLGLCSEAELNIAINKSNDRNANVSSTNS